MLSYIDKTDNISSFIEDFRGLEELWLDNPTVTVGYREYIYTITVAHLGSPGIYNWTSERFGVAMKGEKYWESFTFEGGSLLVPVVLEIIERKIRELLIGWHLEPADYYK